MQKKKATASHSKNSPAIFHFSQPLLFAFSFVRFFVLFFVCVRLFVLWSILFYLCSWVVINFLCGVSCALQVSFPSNHKAGVPPSPPRSTSASHNMVTLCDGWIRAAEWEFVKIRKKMKVKEVESVCVRVCSFVFFLLCSISSANDVRLPSDHYYTSSVWAARPGACETQPYRDKRLWGAQEQNSSFPYLFFPIVCAEFFNATSLYRFILFAGIEQMRCITRSLVVSQKKICFWTETEGHAHIGVSLLILLFFFLSFFLFCCCDVVLLLFSRALLIMLVSSSHNP